MGVREATQELDSPAERLKPLLEIVDPERTTLVGPFLVEYRGQKWAAATDGHGAAMVLITDEATRAALRTNGPSLGTVLEQHEKASTTERGLHSVTALRAFAPVGPAQVKCDTCDGDGEDDRPMCECPHCTGTHPCPDCDNGKTSPAPIRVSLFGAVHVNRHLLARVLATAPGGEVRVFTGGTEDAPLFVSDNWIGVLMPLHRRHDKEPPKASYPADGAPKGIKEGA